ncbi:hypothetical protein H4219_002550 [Mycoemilia scoparia]|uniref:TOG domain-containing protein n=1 Tax=Mycoemilia scoparia TaxID=417184 RepID=A0A9W8DNZ4_9FUNG|nr:hypothetical protein H4219_002550 [Mycoemilia scoparia]
MSAPEDYSSLPLTERLVHKVWKVRSAAYDELAKEVPTLDPESERSKFSLYEGFAPKMIKDTNVAAQEQAIKAILALTENSPNPVATREAVVPVLVEKCLSSPRAGIRAQSMDLLLLYIEVDKPDPVIEKVLSGFDLKTPKAVAAAVHAVSEIIKSFGIKHSNIKPIVKSLSKPFGHRDKTVRAEAHDLTIELYKWIGAALMPSLSDINPVALKELQEKFDSLEKTKPRATRLLRSEKPEDVLDDDGEGEEDGNGEDGDTDPNSDSEDAAGMDPWDLADPVDVLAKLPPNFDTNLASKKWKERKEAVEGLQGVLNTTRIKEQSYGDLVGKLAGRISDVNLPVAILAINCIELLAKGLRGPFAQYQSTVVTPMMEKLKERKQTCVDALRAALDAVFATTNKDTMNFFEYIEKGYSHKNPQIRAESIRLLTRCLSATKSIPSKANIKAITELAKKAGDDGDANVREASTEALGTMMKLVGEKVLMPFLGDVDKIKEAKIREFYEKATISAKPAQTTVKAKPKPKSKTAPAKPKPASAKAPIPQSVQDGNDDDYEPPKPAGIGANLPPALRKKLEASARAAAEKKAAREAKNGGSTAAPPTARPPAPKPKPTPAKPQAKASKSTAPGPVVVDETIRYRFAGDEAIDEKVAAILPQDTLEMLNSKKWKERVEGMEKILSFMQTEMEAAEIEPELMIRQFAKKPGWKESNFQVNLRVYETLKWMAENCPAKFSNGCAALTMPILTDKLGDIKAKKQAGEALYAYAERLSLKFVLGQALVPMSKQKSPKVLGDCLDWVNQALLDFGIAGLQLKDIITFIKDSGLGSSNGQVRQKAVIVMGTLRRFVGPPIATLVEDIPAQLKSLVDAEFDRVADDPPPEPTRSQPTASKGGRSGDGKGGAPAGGDDADEDPMDSLIPRVNISPKITPGLLRMINDNNWKQRKEGLEAVTAILDDAKHRILPELPLDLLTALKSRLTDSNKNLIPVALGIIADLSASMGAPFEQHIRLLALPTMMTLTDKKVTVRQGALKALDAFVATTPAAFDGPIIHNAPKAIENDSPELRENLLGWLAKQLDNRKENLPDLSEFLPSIFMPLQDRNAPVRNNAQKLLIYIISSVGPEMVIDSCSSKLKGASKQTVMPMIEKCRLQAIGSNGGGSAAAGSQGSKYGRGSAGPHGAVSRTARSGSTSADRAPSPGGNQVITAAELVGRRPTPASTSSAAPTTAGAASGAGGLRRPMGSRRKPGTGIGGLAPPQRLGAAGAAAATSASGGGQMPAGRPRMGAGMGQARPPSRTASMTAGSEAEDEPPILNASPKYKEMRARKDATVSSARWQFTDTPRPELINLLNAQMEGHVSHGLKALLFSTGHYKDRDYLTALTSLDDMLSIPGFSEDRYGVATEEMRDRYLAHNDLLFKYISLRLYDNQTHTILKCLDLIEHFFQVMEERNVGWSDYEAHCLLPHLIAQLGNNKEQVKSRVRQLVISRLTHLYPVSKIFQNLLDYGLRGCKNARTRQESLESMSYFVRERSAGLGLSGVCSNPSKIVPQIAQAISDRDAQVRTAALSCLVEMSQHVPGGEGELWRLVGRLPEREKSMLEERLKHRSGGGGAAAAGTGTGSSNSRSSSRLGGAATSQLRSRQLGGGPGSGIKGLHGHGLAGPGNSTGPSPGLGRNSQASSSTSLQSRGYNLNLDGLNLPSYSSHTTTAFPASNMPALSTIKSVPTSYNQGSDHNSVYSQGYDRQYNWQPTPSAEPECTEEQYLEGIIADLSGDDPRSAVDALDQLQRFVAESDSSRDVIASQINYLLPAVRLQMRWAFATTIDPSSSSPMRQTLARLRKATIATLIDVFVDKSLAESAGSEAVSQVLDELLRRLVDPVLNDSKEGDSPLIDDAAQLSQAMNSLVMRILENADRTIVYKNLIPMLESAMSVRLPLKGLSSQQHYQAKYGDLVMRCLWRISKNLKDEIIKKPENLKYDQILPLTHRFFVRLPDSEWRQREDKFMYGDLPKRTIKTINHAIATGLGPRIWDEMGTLVAEIGQENPRALPLSQLHRQHPHDQAWAMNVHQIFTESSETYAYIRHVTQDNQPPTPRQIEKIIETALPTAPSQSTSLKANISPLRRMRSPSVGLANAAKAHGSGVFTRPASYTSTNSSPTRYGGGVGVSNAPNGSIGGGYGGMRVASPIGRTMSPYGFQQSGQRGGYGENNGVEIGHQYSSSPSSVPPASASIRSHDALASQLRALKEKISSGGRASGAGISASSVGGGVPNSNIGPMLTGRPLSSESQGDYYSNSGGGGGGGISSTRPFSMISPTTNSASVGGGGPGPTSSSGADGQSHSIEDLRARLAQMRTALHRPK